MLRRVGTLPFLLEHLDGQTTLAVEGEIDAANTDAFEAILDVVTKADTGTVIVDLTNLAFMDVRGIHAVARSRATIQSLGRSFVLRRPPHPVRRILEVLRPDMDVEPNLPPADVEGNGEQSPPAPQTHSNGQEVPVTPESAYEVIEFVGTSSAGWEQAMSAVVARASQSINNLSLADLRQLDVHIENGPAVTYRAEVTLSIQSEGDAS